MKLLFLFLKAKLSLLFKKQIKVTFKLINNYWYCHIPGWPESMFQRTLMVGEAAIIISDIYKNNFSKYTNEEITFTVYIGKKQKEGWNCLTKVHSSITKGGFYAGCGFNNIWLCPVTLFVLGKYPDQIQFK